MFGVKEKKRRTKRWSEQPGPFALSILLKAATPWTVAQLSVIWSRLFFYILVV